MKINIKKLKFNLYNDEEMEIIKKAFKKCKGNKLNKAKNLLLDINVEELVDRFLEENMPSGLDLDLIEKLITVCKILYANDIVVISEQIYDPMVVKFTEYRAEPVADIIVSKRNVEVDHEYPELKGNIDKANVLSDKQVRQKLDRSVESFVRGLFATAKNKIVKLRLSLKYDGVSGIGSLIDDTIQLLLSRGEDGKGADFTHIANDLSFNNKGPAGVKFEIVITKENFEKLNSIREKQGKKPVVSLRSAVVSILSSSDASKYAHLLSLVPLDATNIGHDASQLNYKYAIDVPFMYEEIEATTVKEAMEQITKIIDKISNEREEYDFAIDGVVIDCLNSDIRKKLGRKNDVNRYQIAYKFPAEERYTNVLGITTTVGRTGLITPMVEYIPVEFNGGKHDKSTLSSFDRYQKCGFVQGEQIKLTYNNDVMPYPHVLDTAENRKLKERLAPLSFPTHCQCGNKLKRDGANYYCDSIKCSGKTVAQYTWFLKTFGIRDIAENTVEDLIEAGIFTSFEDLLNPDYRLMTDIEGIGEKKIKSLKSQIDSVINNPHNEAQLCVSLGIGGDKTCREILSNITLRELLRDSKALYNIKIPGIEKAKKDSFLTNMFMMKPELEHYLETLTVYPVEVNDNEVKVCFTGFRDKKIKLLLEALGVDVVDNVTKDTTYVVVKTEAAKGESSDKLEKARKYAKYGVKIISLAELNDIMKEME